MFIQSPCNSPLRLHAAIATAFLIVSAPDAALLAQGLESEEAIDTIVGSEVVTDEERAAADEQRILKAIENTAANIAEVRKKVSLDKVEIVFLPDLGEEKTTVETRMEEYQDEIADLRKEIEGSAMLYHAIDSRDVLVRDLVALEFDDANGVTIFVSGEEPGQ